MPSAEKLYTPELLALAVSLAEYPPAPELPLHGTARSKSCGSTLAIDLALDAEDAIGGLGMLVRACAVGQAAAAIFARGAPGRDTASIGRARDAIVGWLGGELPQPDWPGFAPLAAVRDLPARHGALLLPWNAALDALSTGPGDG